MYKLKAPDGSNNVCGKNVKHLREQRSFSQREMAKQMQLAGYDVDNHFVRRIENGERFVTDIEIKILSEFLNVTYDDLLN